MIPEDDMPISRRATARPTAFVTSEKIQFAAIALSEFQNRRRRDSLIRHDLFAEPAWDILLDLYVRHHRREPVEVESLGAAAKVATTSILRWIGILIEEGLVTAAPQKPRNSGGRIALSARGIEEMERYLRDFLYRERLGGSEPRS